VPTGQPWLVVIDMQVVFGQPGRPWFTPGYPDIEPTVLELVGAFGEQVVFTRFVAPEHPSGSWQEYYRLWPFALVPADDPLYDLMPAFWRTDRPVVSRTTFGKWCPELVGVVGEAADLVMVGVSTDCCVLATALAAADAGARVRVIADATAGLTAADHDRALAAMALWAPQISVVMAGDVLDPR